MMRLLSIQGLQTKSKPALLRYIIKHLRRKSKKHLVMIAYNISKSKLPRLKVIKRKALSNPYGLTAQERGFYLSKKGKVVTTKRRKTKRKFSAKQLAAQRLFAKRARAGTLRKRRRR